MGVTRERVRQIEAQALSRLRSKGIYRELHAYIENHSPIPLLILDKTSKQHP